VTAEFDDVERLGLLDGFRGQARNERKELVRWLLDRGFGVEQIRSSLTPILLPANRIIGDDGTFISSQELAESSGVPLELIQQLHRAIGLARIDEPGEILHPRADAESILPAAAFVALGFDPEQIALIARLVVDGLTQVAVAMREAAMRSLLKPGATELQLAAAFEALALETEPLVDPLVNQLARLALRHSFQMEAVSAAERAAGALPDARPISVAFADVVGFTRLGEALPPRELVQLAGRLAGLTRDVVTEPVQFVKTIGDAVMLVSPDAEKLVTVALELIEAATGDRLLRLRAGVASGLAVSRAGDWYGNPVNIASRVTSAASPGVVLVVESVRDAIGDSATIDWSFVKATHLRGIRDEIRLYRANRVSTAGP
jgi:adenylate cyclase